MEMGDGRDTAEFEGKHLFSTNKTTTLLTNHFQYKLMEHLTLWELNVRGYYLPKVRKFVDLIIPIFRAYKGGFNQKFL